MPNESNLRHTSSTTRTTRSAKGPLQRAMGRLSNPSVDRMRFPPKRSVQRTQARGLGTVRSNGPLADAWDEMRPRGRWADAHRRLADRGHNPQPHFWLLTAGTTTRSQGPMEHDYLVFWAMGQLALYRLVAPHFLVEGSGKRDESFTPSPATQI